MNHHERSGDNSGALCCECGAEYPDNGERREG